MPSIKPTRICGNTVQDVLIYVQEALASFESDPPDSDFQRGYQAAIEAVMSDLFMTREQRIAAVRKKMP